METELKIIFTSIGYNGCNRHKSAVMYRYNGQKYVQDSDSGFYLENWYHGWALMVFTSKDMITMVILTFSPGIFIITDVI